MLRSMYSGISGMKNFQTKLDVIGNNIANVSTAGFKKGRVTFQDMMSQTTTAAQGATANRGELTLHKLDLVHSWVRLIISRLKGSVKQLTFH